MRATRKYMRNTAVLETLLDDERGNVLRIIDFCPRFRSRCAHLPADDVRAHHRARRRTPHCTVRLRPSAGYGSGEPLHNGGSHHICFQTPTLRYRVTTNASMSAVADASWFVVNEPMAFLLGPDETLDDAPLTVAHRFLDSTRDYWQDWIRGLAIPVEWQEAVISAAITLKLCTFEDTGAVLAALTTSIPEHADSGRNWDYRYCWLRDSYFVIQALNRLGATRTMEAYLRYIDNVATRTQGGELQPLYGIAGEAHIEESIAPDLAGYRGMGPVRVGNQAYLQKQYDVYGAVILAAAQTFFDQRLASPGDVDLFRRLERAGERASMLWDRPDSGPWEFRGVEKQHTFSAAMCWAGCDRLRRIATELRLRDRAEAWADCANRLRHSILENAWNPARGSFTASFGGNDVDATSVLLPELGIVAGSDPRFLQTLDAVTRDLKHGDWLFRYRHPDDFGTPATAFTICAFWYVNALAAAGRLDEARELFQRLLERRTSLGLLAEDIDPVTGELWGNFPQTYSMVGIINCAVRLSRPWEDVL